MGAKTQNNISYTTRNTQHTRLYIKHAESISTALKADIKLLFDISKDKIRSPDIQAVGGTLLLHIACWYMTAIASVHTGVL
jgi:hypothetical protein